MGLKFSGKWINGEAWNWMREWSCGLNWTGHFSTLNETTLKSKVPGKAMGYAQDTAKVWRLNSPYLKAEVTHSIVKIMLENLSGRVDTGDWHFCIFLLLNKFFLAVEQIAAISAEQRWSTWLSLAAMLQEDYVPLNTRITLQHSNMLTLQEA